MLDKSLYPFESHFFHIHGLKYHYLDEGRGEPIVMLHGNPTWSFYYRDLIKALRSYYRIIAPDHIGMGLSDKPDDSRYPYTSRQRVEDLGQLIDYLQLKSFTLVGHDWGGVIGMAYAALNPEKIKAMVMMNTAGFNWPVNKRFPLVLFFSRLPLVSAIFIRGLNAFARGAVWIGMKRRWMKKEVAKGLLHPYGSWKDRIAVHRFVQAIPVRPNDPGYDLGLLMESRLKLLGQVPKLFCWGMKDSIFCSKILNEWLRHFPDAEVHRIEDAGHYILEDAPQEVIPLVEKFMKTKVHPEENSSLPKPTSQEETKDDEFIELLEILLGIIKQKPHNLVVAEMKGFKPDGQGLYDTLTYAQADQESSRLAHGLEKVGLKRGMLTVLMVTPGTDFFSLLAAIIKIGAIPVLVDPGMGMGNLKKCLDEAGPEAFIGIPKAQLARVLFGWAKKTITINITAGIRFGWGGYSIKKIRNCGSAAPYIVLEKSEPEDMALLAYTSGNTGPPKGVVFSQGMLSAQLRFIKSFIGTRDSDAHLATFPPFALFAPACGIPAIIPEMDATRPASADPRKLVAAINDYRCTSTFCSPALIEKIGWYCETNQIKLPSLQQIVSAGAPARMSSIERFVKALNPGVQVSIFYGATEALPLSSIESESLLNDTRKQTERGAGVCVGFPVTGVDVAVIKITENPIPFWSDDLRLPRNHIGEIVAKGPFVSTAYYNLPVQTGLAKIQDSVDDRIWHRMGDVGYLDDQGRLWMCGRKGHRVETPEGTLFSLPCEAIFNNHPQVDRSALVGVEARGRVVPVICIQPEKGLHLGRMEKEQLTRELLAMAQQHDHTKTIKTILYHPSFPVDIRHNAKILREKLSLWAQKEVS
jgi:olefin beta-lactone synthetase